VIATAQGGLGALSGAFEHVAAFGRAAGFALFAAFGRVPTYDFVLLSGGHQSGLMVLAAITLTGVLVALLAQGARIAATAAAVPLGCRAAALRAKSWQAGFLPQRDPDAPGRPAPERPRRARRPPDPAFRDPPLAGRALCRGPLTHRSRRARGRFQQVIHFLDPLEGSRYVKSFRCSCGRRL